MRRVIGHHHHRVGIESVHEQAALIVGGWVYRAAQELGAARAGPLASGIQQSAGGGRIVAALEEPEEAGLFLVDAVMGAVDNGRDPPHHLAVSEGQKKLGFGVAIERVLLAVQQLFHGDTQGWYPVRLAAVERVGQLDELLQRLLVIYRDNVDFAQAFTGLSRSIR